MLKPDELKETLTQVNEDRPEAVTSAVLADMIPDMLRHIGSVDSDLRELIYQTFHTGTTEGLLTTGQMRYILGVCLDDEHLFYGIGGRDTDAVFTRTFSVLLIPLALYMNGREPFLTESEITDIKEKVMRYLRQEKDVRGFVPDKGWAHSTAHGADALDDIAKSAYIGHDALLEILDVIKYKICIDYYAYINKEDDRMAVAVLSVFDRSVLATDEIFKWINSFSPVKKTGEYPEDLHLAINTRNFLRSLYFKLYEKNNMKDITDAVLETLKNL